MIDQVCAVLGWAGMDGCAHIPYARGGGGGEQWRASEPWDDATGWEWRGEGIPRWVSCRKERDPISNWKGVRTRSRPLSSDIQPEAHFGPLSEGANGNGEFRHTSICRYSIVIINMYID
jgi:hypothetical protein